MISEPDSAHALQGLSADITTNAPVAADPGSPKSSSDEPFPKSGRLLGVDYGTKRLGFAICNADQTIASPLENYTRQNQPVDAKCVKRLVSEYRVVGFVVGLPVHMSGDESPKSLESRGFGTWLQQLTGLPVTYADERYSSMFAEQFLVGASFSKKKRQSRLDMLAAQVILQGDLEGRRTAKPSSLRD